MPAARPTTRLVKWSPQDCTASTQSRASGTLRIKVLIFIFWALQTWFHLSSIILLLFHTAIYFSPGRDPVTLIHLDFLMPRPTHWSFRSIILTVSFSGVWCLWSIFPVSHQIDPGTIQSLFISFHPSGFFLRRDVSVLIWAHPDVE